MALYKAGLNFENGHVWLSVYGDKPEVLNMSLRIGDDLVGHLDREACVTLARYLLEAYEKMTAHAGEETEGEQADEVIPKVGDN